MKRMLFEVCPEDAVRHHGDRCAERLSILCARLIAHRQGSERCEHVVNMANVLKDRVDQEGLSAVETIPNRVAADIRVVGGVVEEGDLHAARGLEEQRTRDVMAQGVQWTPN